MPQDEFAGKDGGSPPKQRAQLLIGMGSNLTSQGEASDLLLKRALDMLKMLGLVIRSISRFYRTPAFPAGSGPDYVNAAAVLAGSVTADEVLGHLHAVEEALGRVRTARWGARTLDLDLLAVDDQVLPDAETQRKWRDLPLKAQQAQAPDCLILPHPRLQDRAFVLVPLMDVAPDWRHPLLGLTVRQMHDALPLADRNAVVPL